MSKIEWTEETWNPIIGCSKLSPGCDNCYAEVMAHRLAGMSRSGREALSQYTDVIRTTGGSRWNGRIRFVKSQLEKPLKRKKPTTYFVCSMSDLFQHGVSFEWIDCVFTVMAMCPQHTFQVLTKRPQVMSDYFTHHGRELNQVIRANCLRRGISEIPELPLPNVWLGTTVENQKYANLRIPHLLRCPATVRFLSVEPMLGHVDLNAVEIGNGTALKPITSTENGDEFVCRGIDWVICGGESGPKARPMHPEWARSLRDQCQKAGVPFLFKQWGEYSPICRCPGVYKCPAVLIQTGGISASMMKCGKKSAGRLLDGQQHDGYPEVRHV